MLQSHLFSHTRKEVPQDETSRNAQLLIRAGFVHKDMAGVYSFLPLGLRVLNKIVAIIRKEMLVLGGQEVSLAALQDPAPWQKSGRWDDQTLDIWFKTKLKNDSEVGLATTHEEALATLMKDHISSYRDLPKYVFQFQTKFRNELRAKSGLLRAREFLMKDLYSFTTTAAELDAFYELAQQAYKNIFTAVGLGDRTFLTFASGGSFSKFSHEFQTLTEAGEDTIYLSRTKGIAINKEVLQDDVLSDLGLRRADLEEVKAVEVGNIFKLGTKYSEALGLTFTDAAGTSQPVIMGSYGIGPGRVMATVAETWSDAQGLIWPESIAPYHIHLVELGGQANPDVHDAAADLYNQLTQQGVEVLLDDRDASAGQKFADSDLIGIPTRVVISQKTLAAGQVEVKDRKTGQTTMVKPDAVVL